MSSKFPTENILVFDIETDSTDVGKARLKYFGAYSYKTKQRYYLKGEEHLEFIQEMIDNHDIIVGFNQKRYDIPVLQKYGIEFQYKIQIDLWEIISEPRLDPKSRIRSGGKGRGQYMGLKLNSWSLSNIVKALELGDYKIDDFDYDILTKQPDEWSIEEEKIIIKYLAKDITVTKKLFEYTHNFFYPLHEHLSDKNVRKMTYMTSSIASLAYKIICFEADLPETYGDADKSFEYEGGYVRYPSKENHVGEILCLDFNSLYPSIFRGFNLFSPAPPDYPKEKSFSGNDFFKLNGTYKKDKLGIVEGVLAKLYTLRKQYKSNNDRREYLIKIITNSVYGITPKPVFDQVYNRYGAVDCTLIGREMIKHVAEEYTKNGFEVLYGDTDSVYIALNDKTKADALRLADQLKDFFFSKMPFPHEDFGLGLDEEMKAMFFIKGPDDEYKKKNYVYVTKDDKLKIMGLPIIKSNASPIASKILKKYLKDQIIENLDMKFPIGYLKQLIYHELEKDIKIAAQTYKVKQIDEYDNKQSLYAQISEKYYDTVGNVVTLIPNNRYGIGKAKRYCTHEEFKENKLTVRDIDLTTALNNLEPFTIKEQKTLSEF